MKNIACRTVRLRELDAKSLIRCLSAVVCLGGSQMMSTHAAETQSAESVDGLELIKEVYAHTSTALTSGHGEGRLRQWQKNQLEQDAKIVFEFKGERYVVDLAYSFDRMKRTRRVVVYDGSVVGTSRFSPGITQTGAEGELFSARKDQDGGVRQRMADFPWDASRFWGELCDVPIFFSNVKDRSPQVSKTANDDLQLLYYHSAKKTSHAVLLFEKQYGYRIGSKVVKKADGSISHEYSTKWKEFDGVWCVIELSQERLTPGLEEKWTLEIDEFRPNVPIEDARFTLASLDLPGGARLIDKTQNSADVKDRIHYVPAAEADVNKAAQSIAVAVKELPLRKDQIPASTSEPVGSGAAGRSGKWLLYFNITIAIALCITIGVRKYRASQRSRNA